MSELVAPAGACWIGSAHPFDLHEAYLCFRRDFNRHPAPATLYITADSRYRLWINGEFVARGPARCWPHAQAVDALDLTPFLQPGRNVLAAQVYQPGYSHFAYVHRGASGLLAWMMAANEAQFMTDGSWRTRRDPSFAPDVARLSIYGSGVEDRDFRLDDGWQALNYDDSDWAAARLVAAPTGYPWESLELRATPLLHEHPVSPTLLETRTGAVRSSADSHLELTAGWSTAMQLPHPAESDWHYIKQEEAQATFWLYDLGRDYPGQGWVETRGAQGGETILISYAEKIRDGQLILADPATYCRLRPTDRFRLRRGDLQVESFALRGGRYLLFALLGRADLRLRFGASVAEYPLEIHRRLVTDDATMQGVIAMCEATFHACLLDGFVDSVWRESSQWVGDALPQALIMASMSDDERPRRQVIRMAAQGAYPDGMLPSVLPGEVHAYAVVDYNFMWVELLALDWRLTGDRSFLAAHWRPLTTMLGRFHAGGGPDGLIRNQPGRRLFLDWSPQSRGEPSAVLNLHYLLALQVSAGLAAEFGAQDDELAWRARETALRATVRQMFLRHRRWYDDLEGTTYSQLAAALAVITGVVANDELPDLLDDLAARSLDDSDEHSPGRMVLASPFMHHYVFEALRTNGRAADVVAIIRRRWGRWVTSGYPTTWENWAVDFSDGSQCHAFSAHPRYHLQQIALAHAEFGIRQTERDPDRD